MREMYSSIYDDALSQLHSNYQSLQENIVTMVREQNKMFEVISRVQQDLEMYKDSQNNRLDEILTNIDMDVKKVSNETKRVEVTLDRKVADSKTMTAESVNKMSSELEILKCKVDKKMKLNDSDLSSSFYEESIKKDLLNLKNEMQGKFTRLTIETGKIVENMETSTLAKIEHYISTEVIDEIVGTINNKLGNYRSEVQNDLELQKIQIEDNKLQIERINGKMRDFESTKKCFNESDLFASSVDLTRTPLRLAQQSCLKTPTRAASPILECEEEEVGEGEASRRSHHSTPRSATSGDRDHDVTLYEDIRSSALTIANTEDNDNGTKPLEVEVEVLSSGDVNAMDYREDFDEFGFIEEWKTGLPLDSEEDQQVYMEFKQNSKSKRRDSIISNIFMNITNILDV